MRPLPDPYAAWPHWARLMHRSMRVYLRLWQQAQCMPSSVPAAGAAILACNHVSVLDPVLLIASNTRTISFIIAQEYYANPVLRPFLDAVGCIPVRRDRRDQSALRQAREVLAAGRVLGLFPEGGIQRDATAAKAGIAWLVQESGAPVIPVHVSGATQYGSDLATYMHRQRPRLRYGAPRYFEAGTGRQRILAEVMAAIAALA